MSAGRPGRIVPSLGHETIWAHASIMWGGAPHQGGHALSLQYHNQKDETIHLLRGEMIYRIKEGEQLVEKTLKAGGELSQHAGDHPSDEAVTDCDVLEASTPHLDDVCA